MSWEERIKEAAYTPPSGTRLTFDYEDVKQTVELRGTLYDFVDTQGTYVQSTGSSGDSFPMRIFISGPNYDTKAKTFMAALKEAGEGLLEHPIHGMRTVVPLGRVLRRDDLKTAANQAIFEFTMWETIGSLYPSGHVDPASQVLQAVSDYNAAAAAEFADVITLDTQIEAVALENKTRGIIDAISASVSSVSDSTQAVRDQFDDIFDSVNNSISVLVGDPLTLAFQVVQLVQSPARAISLWSDKLDAYKNLADSIFGQVVQPSSGDSRNKNAFYADDLAGAGALTGAVVGAVNSTFSTRPEALEAAQELLLLSDKLNTWRELNYESLGQVDTGGAYQQWQNAAAIAAGFLVQISFALAQEHVIILDRPRTIVDLSAELYGSIDDKLDFLIDTNNLTGDEIKELPVGRLIKYYV